MATETGSKAVDAGSQQFGELATSFRRIAELVETTTEAAREIELSTKQQATAVEQVNIAISNVAQATRETEASAGQTLATATQLAQLSVQLSKLIQPEGLTGGPRPVPVLPDRGPGAARTRSGRARSSSRCDPDPERIRRMLRQAHTLKGAARVVREVGIGDAAHALEDLLAPYRESGGPATAEGVDGALRARSTRIRERLGTLGAPAAFRRAPCCPAAARRTTRRGRCGSRLPTSTACWRAILRARDPRSRTDGVEPSTRRARRLRDEVDRAAAGLRRHPDPRPRAGGRGTPRGRSDGPPA